MIIVNCCRPPIAKQIERVAPHAVRRGASSRKGTWYVLHPVNLARVGDERSRDVRRKAPYCECGMELSLTGVCGSCDQRSQLP